MLAAVEIESPTPVPIATYAARHNGHLGNSTRTALGTIHRAIPERRRTKLGEASVSQQQVLIIDMPPTVLSHDLADPWPAAMLPPSTFSTHH